jgi:hypothetical protein
MSKAILSLVAGFLFVLAASMPAYTLSARQNCSVPPAACYYDCKTVFSPSCNVFCKKCAICLGGPATGFDTCKLTNPDPNCPNCCHSCSLEGTPCNC